MTDIAPASTASPAPEPSPNPVPPPREILGLGRIYADVLTLFVRRLPKILLLALPGSLAVIGLLYLLFNVLDDNTLVRAVTGRSALRFLWPVLAIVMTTGVGFGLVAGPMTAAWHNHARTGRIALRSGFKAIWRRPFQAVVLSILVSCGIFLPFTVLAIVAGGWFGFFTGLCALAVGMYALGHWGPALPSIHQDNLGFNALGRSARLGKGYRTAIAGTCFLLLLTAMLLGGLMAAGLGILFYLIFERWLDINIPNDLENLLVLGDTAVSLSCTIALLGLGLAAIRARMVEIKEPPDIGDLVKVFD